MLQETSLEDLVAIIHVAHLATASWKDKRDIFKGKDHKSIHLQMVTSL